MTANQGGPLVNAGASAVDAANLYAAFDRERAKKQAELGKVNVLIAGSSGVGKSTLINAVFGQALAKTGVGKPVTQSIDLYEPSDSTLRIYDTRGFEIRNAEATVAAVREKIAELRRSTDANAQIHIAWICILESSRRVEEVHKQFLQMLKKEAVPAVVVITQALEDREMLKAVKRLAVPNNGIIPVLAERVTYAGQTVDAYGVEELVDQTLKLLPQARKAAFVAAQRARWDLKEKEAIVAIKAAAGAAAASALIPVPGGHSATLATIQVGLMGAINAIIGISLGDSGGKDFLKGFLGMAMTHYAGQSVFLFAISEALKFIPGLGYFGAAAIGGGVAGPFTYVFGHAYLDSVKQYAQRGEPLPSAERLADEMKRVLELNGDRYKRLAKK